MRKRGKGVGNPRVYIKHQRTKEKKKKQPKDKVEKKGAFPIKKKFNEGRIRRDQPLYVVTTKTAQIIRVIDKKQIPHSHMIVQTTKKTQGSPPS